MSEKIFMIGGSKGGVGKSIVCSALVDYLTAIRNKKIYLIESDTSNPDVGRTYFKPVDGVQRLPGAAFDLDDAEGWINFINAAEQYPDHHTQKRRSDDGPPSGLPWKQQKYKVIILLV